jgi:hypothetical protein
MVERFHILKHLEWFPGLFLVFIDHPQYLPTFIVRIGKVVAQDLLYNCSSVSLAAALLTG